MQNFFSLYEEFSEQIRNVHTPLLQCQNMSFSWNRKKASASSFSELFTDITISVGAEDFVSILGETGTGKTTLARIFAGVIHPTRGSVKTRGVQFLYDTSEGARLQYSRVQLMPQIAQMSFHPLLSIHKSLQDSFRIFAHKLYIQRMQVDTIDMYRPRIDRKARKELKKMFEECIMCLCKELGIDVDILSRLPEKVSGGQLQRCALMRMLLVFPDIIILDEPVSHLDVRIRKATLELIQYIRSKTHIAVVFMSHLPETHGFFEHFDHYRRYKLVKSELEQEYMN